MEVRMVSFPNVARIAAMGLAILERALELTVQYSRERHAFGKALIEFQNSAFMLAEVKTDAVASRAFLDTCTNLLLS